MLVLTELTMANLRAGGDEVDRRDFLARADLLAACGMTVLISDYFAYYRLAAYLAWRTDGRIGMVMGVPSLIDLFDEKQPRRPARRHPGELRPAVQERPAALRLPDAAATTRSPPSTTVVVADELQPLYDYLAGRGSFVDLDNYKPDYLPILSRDVLRRIASGDDDVGGDGAAGGGRADQEARLLRLPPPRRGLAGAALSVGAVHP